MSEASFTLFQNTAVGIEVILYACCLTAFFYPYMAGRKRGHPADIIKMLAVFASYSIIYFFNMAVSMGALVCMASVIVLLTLAAKYLGVEKKTALFMGVVNIIPLGSHQFPASEPSGNGIFHLQSHHNILWQHTYLISL